MNFFINFLFEKTPLFFLIQSLWRDEAFSILLAKKSIPKIIFLTAKDFNPPLYYLLLKFWILIFGDSEIAARTLSLLFYVFSIYAFVLILESLFKKNKGKVFFATLVFSTLPITVYYAFEARMYSLLLFLTLIFYLGIINKNERLWKIAGLAGAFTHYFFLFNFLIFFLIADKKQKKELLKLSFFPFLWILFVTALKLPSHSGFWIKKLQIKELLYLPFYLLAAYDKNWEPLYKNALKISLFTYFLLFLSLKFSSLKKKEKKLVSLWFFLPFLLSLFLSLSFLPIFLPRYLIFITPAFVILLASINKRFLCYLSLLFVFFFNFKYNKFLIKNKRKENLKKKIYAARKILDKNTIVYILKPEEYPVYVYYLGEEKVYIYKKPYEEIPNYVGKILIPKEKITSTPPFYPKRAIIFNGDKGLFLISLK